MDDAKLAEIEALAAAATPGPWRAGAVTAEGKVWCPYREALEGPNGERCLLNMNTSFPHSDDRAFIATARTAVPALTAEVRRLRAALGAVRGYLETMEREVYHARDARSGRGEQVAYLVNRNLRVEDGYRQDWALFVCDVRVAESNNRAEIEEMAQALESALTRMVRLALESP